MVREFERGICGKCSLLPEETLQPQILFRLNFDNLKKKSPCLTRKKNIFCEATSAYRVLRDRENKRDTWAIRGLFVRKTKPSAHRG